jgi:hypothetical protein
MNLRYISFAWLLYSLEGLSNLVKSRYLNRMGTGGGKRGVRKVYGGSLQSKILVKRQKIENSAFAIISGLYLEYNYKQILNNVRRHSFTLRQSHQGRINPPQNGIFCTTQDPYIKILFGGHEYKTSIC